MDMSTVRAAEQELLSTSTRRDESRLRELIHRDFVEIGRSGRRWTRDEIVTALAQEGDRVEMSTDDWEFVELAPDLVLVTYVIRRAVGDSRHSSIWSDTDGRLQLRFHQGTPIAGA